MSAPTLGSRIRARRQRLGLTLKDLAQRANLSVPYLSDIERANVTNPANPTLETLTALAEALGTTVGDLLGGRQAVADGPPLSVSLQRFVRGDDFARRVQRLAQAAGRPVEDVRQEVVNFLATAPKRASGELTLEDWRRLLTYYASLLDDA